MGTSDRHPAQQPEPERRPRQASSSDVIQRGADYPHTTGAPLIEPPAAAHVIERREVLPTTVDFLHAPQWRHTRAGLSLVLAGVVGILLVVIGMGVTIALGEVGFFASLERTQIAQVAEFEIVAPDMTTAGVVASVIAALFLLISLIGLARCVSVPKGTGLKSLAVGALVTVIAAVVATVAAIAWGDVVLASLYGMGGLMLLVFGWLLFLFFLRGANRLLAQRHLVVSTGILMIGYGVVVLALLILMFSLGAGVVSVAAAEQMGPAVGAIIGGVVLALLVLYLVILARTRTAIDRSVPIV